MITSSLPPELKVLIASGFLLGGGLFAQRFPADRVEEPVVAQTVTVIRSETPTSPTTSKEPTSMTPGVEEGTRYAPIEKFVNDIESGEWSHTSMSESVAPTRTDRTSGIGETPELDPGHYAGMNVETSRETAQIPKYEPFQTTRITLPEPNPAFFAAKPSPPNLTGLSLSGVSESADIVPSIVVSPSAVMPSEVPANRISPITTDPPITKTLARPVVSPVPMATADFRPAHRTLPVVVPSGEPRGNVIVAPARTVILPSQ